MNSSGKKRERNQDGVLPDLAPATSNSATSGSTTNFRNVSACNRCRNRKNRCDQRLPKCTGCEKANVKCVGFDPVSKRAIPRNYVYYLETRVEHLEALLQANNAPCPPPSDDFAIGDSVRPGINVPFAPLQDNAKAANADSGDDASALDPALQQHDDQQKLAKLVHNVGMVSVQGASDPRQATRTPGIPFSKVVYAAVKSSVSQTPSERAATKPSKQLPSSTASGGGGSDSFFGLNSKPIVKPAPFPEQHIGLRLCELYFEHANPQIPILHRGEFMSLVEKVYATDIRKRRPRELYLLNIVFAIGSGIIMNSNAEQAGMDSGLDDTQPNRKRQRLATQQHQPEEYHAAAIVHLDGFPGAAPAVEGAIGGLEELQAVLLLAGLALLRPVSPGLWYIIGLAVRLAVDLGLHNEEIDVELDNYAGSGSSAESAASNIGRRQWVRDLRRRLWWCVYSFDRLVSTCVGRPFGVADQVVTTEFPSLLDDRYITPSGLIQQPSESEQPSYKHVAHHYFRLRLLQSEILQVLQHRQAEQARAVGANSTNPYMYTELPSPFLAKFHSFRDWRIDVDRRLWEWRDSAPQQASTGVAFTPLFLELNYWQAIIMLYRQALTVPEPLAGELSPSTGGEVQSPSTFNVELKEDEEVVFMKVAQAGQTVLKVYRQLHRLKLVNYTFLATHHLFMSGISFLYAIWHSTLVRSQLTVDDVDFTIFIATSVLTDLIEKCPPAEACRDAFARMSKATITMVMSTTGFGNVSTLASQPLNSPGGYFHGNSQPTSAASSMMLQAPKPQAMPQFDTKLRDLFSEDEIAGHVPAYQPSIRLRDEKFAMPAPSAPTFKSEPPTYSAMSPQSGSGASQYQALSAPPANIGYQLSNQQPYQPIAKTISQAQGDFSFDDLSFLDTFPITDPNTTWNNTTSDLDLGFGTGGMAYDANDANVDLFDGFFFGNS